ncbi:MAG: diaminopimelate epimerase [Cryomorphaceae bacterium]
MEFYKYHGAGNDFILIDDRNGRFPDATDAFVSALCDRHFGIGADGLILLREIEGYSFEMVYFNSDGNLSSMCGNGGRCITRFAADLGIIETDAVFLAVDGPHHAKVNPDGTISLQMKDVLLIESLSPDASMLDTGSPHYVERSSNVQDKDMKVEGRRVRYNDRFAAEGINVNLIEWKEGELHIRTYERGVEDETLACGTGVTAAAIVAHLWGLAQSPVKVQAVGGALKVSFDVEHGVYKNVWKTGPAVRVFKGEFAG